MFIAVWAGENLGKPGHFGGCAPAIRTENPYQIFPADRDEVHPAINQSAIVGDEIWNNVHTMLGRNGHRGGRNIGNKHGALLKGLVRCATCDVGMIHTYVEKKNRVYRYYVCIKAHQHGWTQCETRSVSAPALESVVLEQLRGIGSNPTVLRSVLQKLNEHANGECPVVRRN